MPVCLLVLHLSRSCLGSYVIETIQIQSGHFRVNWKITLAIPLSPDLIKRIQVVTIVEARVKELKVGGDITEEERPTFM